MKSKNLIIIGGGGHSKVVLSAILNSKGFQIKGILDAALPVGRKILGYPVLGSDQELLKMSPSNVCLTIGVGSMQADDRRKKIFNKWKTRGYQFPIIRHSKSLLAESATIGEGTQIMCGVIVQPKAQIGANCIINTGVIIEHDCQISSHTHISPGTILGGGVTIGKGSLVGLGARVLPGIRIGKGVTVGAGAVITKDVKDGETVVGIPAHRINK